MTLEEIRGQWETKQKVMLVVTKQIGSYSSVFVILQASSEQYRLQRYFPIGENWNCSVDKQGDLQKCLDGLTKHFLEVYPKEKPCLQE